LESSLEEPGLSLLAAKNLIRFRFIRAATPVILVCAITGMPVQLCGQTLPKLTSVRDIRALSPEQARQARPVLLRGVVTVFSGFKSSFFFQDATAGISVARTNDSPKVRPGQLVEIRGFTGPGMFAPVVTAESITVLGKGNLPAARVFGMDQLAGGKLDSQFLAIRGIVRSAVIETIWERSVLVLEIDIGGGNLAAARIHDFSPAGFERLPGSTVVVRGVCGTVFNDKRQFLGVRMYVEDLDDVSVQRLASEDPFDLPIKPLESMLQYGDQGGAIARVKVRGTITYSQPGQGLYIQDGSQGLFVQSRQTTPIAAGAQLEVVGYPAPGRYSPKLDDAVFRVVGAGPPIAGLPQTASAMITYNDGSPAAPYDGALVQLQGRLVEEIARADENLLLLRDGASVFTASLPRSGQNRAVMATGSLLRITGICMANADETHEAHSFEILLRSPADIVVLDPAPWWNASRAAWIVALLILVVLGMSGWLAFIRRQASLRVLTLTDHLTGLYNRRGFLLLAEHQRQMALRKKTSILIFYIDVDCFKEINDSLGHKEGDLVLVAIAVVLRHSFRKADIIGRLGGDEFAVIADGAPPHTRPIFERRLAEAVLESNQKADRKSQVSLSIGILECDGLLGDFPIEELLAKADALMYQQKQDSKKRRA
jgi:diguanylate cyclase (GGDEF)-like protein